MKPKFDQNNGYLTPQASKRKSLSALSTKPKSGSQLQNGSPMANLLNLDKNMVQNLLNDPIKRKLIVDIITSHKDQIDEYKKTHGLEGISKLHKAQTKPICESPTALFRRRALKQKERAASGNDSESLSSNSRPNSALSGASAVPSPLPFNKILDGVIAFVEVQTNGNDRSQGVKIRIKEMGATVRDQFTKDVTHLIFKDGFFTTYKKAQLIKAHIVSVLWIEACRNEGFRVPEKKYPAIGPEIYDSNASALCSQMQKEYEEVIRDELNKSFTTGTPLPTKQDLINKRRTMMTQSVSKTFSQEFPSSQDFEVSEIFRKSRRTLGPIFTHNSQSMRDSSDDDDSDLRVVINGIVTDLKDTSGSSSNDVVDSSYMDFTGLHGTVITQARQTPKEKENVQPVPATPNLDRSKSSVSSYATAVDPKSPKDSPTIRSTSGIKILSKNVCSPRAHPPDECVSTAMSTLQISDKTKTTTSTTMSSLRVSSESKATDSQHRLDKFVTVRKKSVQNGGEAECSPPKKGKTDSDSTPSGLLGSGDVDTAKADPETDVQIREQLDKTKDKNKNKKPDKATESTEADKIPSTTNSLIDRPIRTRKSIYSRNQKQTKPVLDNENVFKENKPITNIREKPIRTRKSIYNKIDTQIKPVLDVDSIDKQSAPNTDKEHGSNCDQHEKPNAARKSLYPDDKKQSVPTTTEAAKDKQSVDAEGLPKPDKSITTSDNSTEGSADEKQIAGSINSAKKKARRLFNPADIPSCEAAILDDQEREQKRELAKKKKTDGVFIRPTYINSKLNVLVSQKAREYIDEQNVNIDDVLNKQTDSDSDHKSTKKKKKQTTKKRTDYDDRFSLTKGIFAKKDEEPKPSRKSVRLSRKPRLNYPMDSESEEVSPPKPTASRRKTLGSMASTSFKKPSNKNDSQNRTTSGPSDVSPAKPVASTRKTLGKMTQMTPKKSTTSTCVSNTDPFNRRSTLEFQPKDQMNSARRLKIDKLQKPTIVCTMLHRDDVVVFNQIVKKLGKFNIEDEVSSSTTHLVAGEPKRTINMLRAIARGCWILKYEWLLKSLEAEKWLPEEDFEETDFSPAVQQSRLQRQAFGPSYSMDVFQDSGVIYVAKGSTPRCSDLKELIRVCGGKVTTIARNADVIVGGYQKRDDVTCVTELWVLDCIKFNKRIPMKKYRIHSDNNVML
ncbi:unnamed protein product [Callosobruchus maculatus]|uniref:BRCT domain-containing protein n=1 Tax=Callosobruchus maculatus TaxID=64391 RepID=A0A653BYG6_CALMS|nr:unnamed protein product [Callosobruchus maculatus]